jgi:hypothetical protein
MTDPERLHAAVLANLSDPLVKLALADALEEQGDQRIVVNDHLWIWSADYAYAMRWLASRGKYPWYVNIGRDGFLGLYRWHGEKVMGRRGVAALPQEMFDLLPVVYTGANGGGRAYASPHVAMVYLAEVLTRLRDVVSLAPLPESTP